MADTHDDFEPFMAIPSYLSQWPQIIDQLDTPTLELQARTVRECLPFLSAVNEPSSNPFDFDEQGLPLLDRSAHVGFVHDGLETLPSPFVAMDASRPWLMYWSLLSLYILGEDVRPYASSIVTTFKPLQNASGGFGGGQGHLSHLAGTYAIILAVAMVGSEEAYELVDRPTLWHWLGQLKSPNGGFQVCKDGEEDVRGAYCALVAITLLDLPWQLPADAPARASGLHDFRDGLGEYLSRCQTYEGGVSAGPSNEAHGAYTFCALACLSILGPPHETIRRYFDLESMIRWLSARQYAPEGGFAGRTNKVVDGCYSHWIGGCWPLVEAALNQPTESPGSIIENETRIFDSEGLARYILGCCQAKTGGLRDKPSKRPDAYHTCYNLAGLSMAHHYHHYSNLADPVAGLLSWDFKKRHMFAVPVDGESEDSDELPAVQPVYVIPHEAVLQLSRWARRTTIDFSSKSVRIP